MSSGNGVKSSVGLSESCWTVSAEEKGTSTSSVPTLQLKAFLHGSVKQVLSASAHTVEI